MPPKKTSPSKSTKDAIAPSDLPANWHYERTVSEIEAIIGRIEAGELELAEVFQQFSQAVEYLNQCETFLNQHQQQADLLIETLLDREESGLS
ncbi:MAG: exodeoxyribonuclease VII small subunit [Synechococcales cyanobacterium T60_A2020_003]|nr:exodeoxyribonuclease VII small subunit [Synechococcales cyanobacterium T60_A2020_003]